MAGVDGNAMSSVTNNKKVSCHTYNFDKLAAMSISRRDAIAVYAGHFYYDSIVPYVGHKGDNSNKTMAHIPDPTSQMPQQEFSCLIMVREPVSQFLSCYRERFQRRVGLEAAKLTLEQLEDVLTNSTDRQALHGCNNEIARFLSPVPNDDYVNKGWLTAHDIALTKNRIARCTIGDVVQHTEEMLRVLRHWHPWLMEDYNASTSQGHRAPSNGTSKVGDLSEEAAALILRYNALANDLYGFAMERFQLQLEELDRLGL